LPFSHLDSPLYLGGFRGESTSFLHSGTAEPIGIAPAKPVAYIMELYQYVTYMLTTLFRAYKPMDF